MDIDLTYEGFPGIMSLCNRQRIEFFKETMQELISQNQIHVSELDSVIHLAEADSQYELAEAAKQITLENERTQH